MRSAASAPSHLRRPWSGRTPFTIWLATLLTLGLFGAGIVFATYNEFLDCSNPELHESASTPLGWTVAGLATGLPLLVGLILGRRHSLRLAGLALLVAGVQAVIWVWALNPGGCEWAMVAA